MWTVAATYRWTRSPSWLAWSVGWVWCSFQRFTIQCTTHQVTSWKFVARWDHKLCVNGLEVCSVLILYLAAVVAIFFILFLAYFQRLQIGCLPYFHAWCGLSANLECRSETCCTWLAENTGHKNHQNATSAHHCTILSVYIFASKHVLTIGE